MISVSTIKSYMFCPLKLYFQSNIDEEQQDDYFISKTLKDLRMDIQDLFHKNLRHVKKDMDEKEIEKRLAIGINNQIKTTFAIIEEMNEKNRKKETDENKETDDKTNYNLKNDEEIEFIDDKIKSIDEVEELKEKAKGQEKWEDERLKLEELKEELTNEINFNLKILSLKTAQAMKILDKNGDEIQGLFFPSSMYNYLIRDIGLDLIGVIFGMVI